MANIVFNNYTPVEEEDAGEIEIKAGMFFDGTKNNQRNTYIRKEREKKKNGVKYDEDAVKEYPFGFDKDSYLNDYSNVVRMYPFYTSAKTIYIEGIGTLNGDTDTTEAYLIGTGPTGIRAKVRTGCEELKKIIPINSIVNVTLDVFGFSRGAAAARAFVNEITKPSYASKNSGLFYTDIDGIGVPTKKLPANGTFGLLCQGDNITIKSIKINVVGLYDTVSSYGGNFENDNSSKADIEELGLSSIIRRNVMSVIQLAAGHEWRKNFNLTTIQSVGKKGLEVTLPGAHADIGGCYEDETFTQNHNESVNPARVINDPTEYSKLANEKRKPFYDAGWYRGEQLKISDHSNKYVNHIDLIGVRYIDKRYSYIPLHFMCSLSKNKGANFKDSVMEKYKIPAKAGNGIHLLHYVKLKLEKYILDVEKSDFQNRNKISYKNYLDLINEKKLINGFIHWSATEKTGHDPRESKTRTKIFG